MYLFCLVTTGKSAITIVTHKVLYKFMVLSVMALLNLSQLESARNDFISLTKNSIQVLYNYSIQIRTNIPATLGPRAIKKFL